MPKWWTDTVWRKCQWLFYCNLWIAKEPCMCTVGLRGLRAMSRHAAYPPLYPSKQRPLKDERRKKDYRRRTEIALSTFLDTQSSLKLTTVYAVSEDSHRGGPVLLERLINRGRHTHTHTQVERKTEAKTNKWLCLHASAKCVIQKKYQAIDHLA